MNDTYFASAARIPKEQLQQDIDYISGHPVIKGLLTAASGILAILNEHRQVLAMNETFLKMLGISDAATMLGMRPGEVVNCVHASEMSGGCGTAKPCATCGAAIAIVSSLASAEPVERKCALTALVNGQETDISLRVRACRIILDDRPFVVLFLQDITAYERWAMLERTFFHDIINLVSGLAGNCYLLALDDNNEPSRELIEIIYALSMRLTDEVKLQAMLLRQGVFEYQVSPQEMFIGQIIYDIQEAFINHPAAQGKRLAVPHIEPSLSICSDATLVLRVLTNMVLNAFEATEPGGEVRLKIDSQDHALCFCVWNDQAILDTVAPRIFQRHFSTKADSGRGIGTYSMKLFGEKFLKGKVSFTSSPSEGTEFRLCLPLSDAL